MEGNKDEAERCIEIAKKYIDEGNSEKAKKFLQKAERLFPTDKAKGNYYLPLVILVKNMYFS